MKRQICEYCVCNCHKLGSVVAGEKCGRVLFNFVCGFLPRSDDGEAIAEVNPGNVNLKSI